MTTTITVVTEAGDTIMVAAERTPSYTITLHAAELGSSQPYFAGMGFVNATSKWLAEHAIKWRSISHGEVDQPSAISTDGAS